MSRQGLILETAPEARPRPGAPAGINSGARAAHRLEYKFLAPLAIVPELRAALTPWVRLDRFAADRPKRQYTVRSVYYDNRRFDCYEEKLEGFTHKRKLRIRGYDTPGPDSIVFLEIKYKNQDYIGKSRAPVRWDRLGEVFAQAGAGSDHEDTKRVGYDLDGTCAGNGPRADRAVRRFLYHYYRRRMLPSVLVAYEREAFYSRFDSSLRITFDKNVRSRLYPRLGSLYADQGMAYVLPGRFVFEVKFFGSLPRWVRTLATRFELHRVAVSKYALGIECHRVEKKFIRWAGHLREQTGNREWRMEKGFKKGA